MKYPVAITGAAALLLTGCGEKQEETSAERKEIPTRTVSAPASDSTLRRVREVEPATPAEEPVAEDEPAAEPATPALQPAAEVPAESADAETTGEATPERPSAEERQARFREQMTRRFAEMDADGDGVVTASEMPERMQRRFDRLDTNGDGALDAAEQEAMIERFSERGGRRGFRNEGGPRGQGGPGFRPDRRER